MVSLVRVAKFPAKRGKGKKWAPVDPDGDGIAVEMRAEIVRINEKPADEVAFEVIAQAASEVFVAERQAAAGAAKTREPEA